jgi:uncharacterized protein (TIGR00369 family)
MPPSIFDELKAPPAAVLLGWRLIDLNLAERWIKVGFDGKPEFRNPAGNIQGGILAAMLDDTMGPIVIAATDKKAFPATVDLSVSFIRPVRPGPITVLAQISGIAALLAPSPAPKADVADPFHYSDRLLARASRGRARRGTRRWRPAVRRTGRRSR